MICLTRAFMEVVLSRWDPLGMDKLTPSLPCAGLEVRHFPFAGLQAGQGPALDGKAGHILDF
jgi:hypothetical protein